MIRTLEEKAKKAQRTLYLLLLGAIIILNIISFLLGSLYSTIESRERLQELIINTQIE